MDIITSRANPKIKRVRALRKRKQRDADGAFLVEGIHHVGAAIEAGASVEAVFYAPELLEGEYPKRLIERLLIQAIPCNATTVEVFNSVAEKENPQGILAVVRQREADLREFHADNFAWGVGLVAPQDPGNVGAILRTMDAVGADGMLLLDDGADPYHPTAVRASMGSIFRLPVIGASFAVFARWVGEHGYHVYGTSAHASQDYRSIAGYKKPLILLLGSEREGLTSEQAAICEAVVSLPMHGKVTSLNLAVSAGVMLYTILDKTDP